MLTDIHTHILHSIDDGPQNFEQSVELLNQSVQNGVKNIIATPHFYATRHSLNERLTDSKNKFSQLSEFVSQNKVPVSLLSGFEVRFFEGISRIDVLKDLCINGSDFLLLELDYAPITQKVVDEILDMSYFGYNIILAHVERYTKEPGFKNIKALISEGEVISQCNASSFVSGTFQRAAFRLLKERLVYVVASDMHSVDERPSNLNQAYDVIEKKFGSEMKNQLIYNAEELFAACLKNKKERKGLKCLNSKCV